jgi:hypothetical protein
VVVAVPTEDNADRISAFNTRRLVPPECAEFSSIVSIEGSIFPFRPALVHTMTTRAAAFFTKFDAFQSPRVTQANFATESPGGQSSPEVFGVSAEGHDKAPNSKARNILPWHELVAAVSP